MALLLVLPFPLKAQTDGDYITFATKAQKESQSDSTCLKYGGRQVTPQHHEVVLRMGRQDDDYANVIYHGGDQYVAFSIRTGGSLAKFLGQETQITRLCHFP